MWKLYRCDQFIAFTKLLDYMHLESLQLLIVQRQDKVHYRTSFHSSKKINKLISQLSSSKVV